MCSIFNSSNASKAFDSNYLRKFFLDFYISATLKMRRKIPQESTLKIPLKRLSTKAIHNEQANT